MLRRRSHFLDRLAQQCGEIDRLRFQGDFSSRDPRDVEQHGGPLYVVRHQTLEPLDLADHAVLFVGVGGAGDVDQLLDAQEHRGHRIAQFMRRNREETVAGAECFGELVVSPPEFAELIA